MYCILLCNVNACRHVCLWIKYYDNIHFNICSFWLTDRNRLRNYKNNKVKQLQLQQITKQHISRTSTVLHRNTELNQMFPLVCMYTHYKRHFNTDSVICNYPYCLLHQEHK